MANKKRSVGLVVLTEVPGLGVVVVLQRRGKNNPEKFEEGKINESYPGGCRVTCHGRVRGIYCDERDALYRKSLEEIGKDASFFVLTFFNQFVELVRHEGDDESSVIFGFVVHNGVEFLKKIRLHPSSGGLELLSQGEVRNIRNLGDFDKRVGVTDSGVIAMFPDEVEAVRLAFEKLVPES